MGVVQPF
jgi:AcrR family transcriptional regulator